jgi:hypothetical protein
MFVTFASERAFSIADMYTQMQGTTNQHLSDHLSDLVETTLSDLENTKCIE